MIGQPRYGVQVFGDIEAVAPLLEQLAGEGDPGFIFQDLRWLRLWYESFRPTGAVPLLAVVTKDALDEPLSAAQVALVFPLIRRVKHFLLLVEFADLGITDYNLPIPGPCAPQNNQDLSAILVALEQAVRPFARLRLTKMPGTLNGRPSLFHGHRNSRVLELTSHHMTLPSSGAELQRSLGKKKRVAIQRAQRGLDDLGTASFAVAETATDRRQILSMIQRVQRLRRSANDEHYFHEDPGFREFYDELVLNPMMADVSVLSALWLDGRPVVGLLGLRHQDRYIASRIAVDDAPPIMRLGLGKLLLFRTASWAIEKGLQIFDFSLGGNALKAWFHPAPLHLLEYQSLLGGRLSGNSRPSRWANDVLSKGAIPES